MLLVYDSMFGNTALIARKIEETFTAHGHSVISKRVDEADNNDIRQADLLIIGAPTQGFTASKKMLEFLDKVEGNAINNSKVIAFDTRIDVRTIESKFLRWLVRRGGYAVTPIVRKLKNKGAQIIGAEGFLVTGREGPLLEGEVKRADEWIKTLLENQKGFPSGK